MSEDAFFNGQPRLLAHSECATRMKCVFCLFVCVLTFFYVSQLPLCLCCDKHKRHRRKRIANFMSTWTSEAIVHGQEKTLIFCLVCFLGQYDTHSFLSELTQRPRDLEESSQHSVLQSHKAVACTTSITPLV